MEYEWCDCAHTWKKVKFRRRKQGGSQEVSFEGGGMGQRTKGRGGGSKDGHGAQTESAIMCGMDCSTY